MAPARKVRPRRPPTRAAQGPVRLLPDLQENEAGYTGAFERLAARRLAPAADFPDKNEDPALIAKAAELFASKTCVHLPHDPRGSRAVGVTGPELTHVGARTTIAGGLLENNRDEIHRWIHAPNAVKPGNKMWVTGYLVNNIKLTPDDEDALVPTWISLK
jgi:cytochrome c oxidase subunit 2